MMPRSYYRIYIEPSFDDWHRDPQNLRVVTNLCNDINDLADYLCYHDNPTATDLKGLIVPFRKDWETRCPEYALVHDIADAKKHWRLTRKDRRLTLATQTALRGDPPDPNNKSIQLDLRRIIITDDTGREVIFDKIIRRVIRFVDQELRNRGL